jgi:hypothetical protein
MKNWLALGLGVAMIVAAFLIAAETTNQDNATRPEVAHVFATALHVEPTATFAPLPTETWAPTPTRIQGWAQFAADGVALWLPQNSAGAVFDQLSKNGFTIRSAVNAQSLPSASLGPEALSTINVRVDRVTGNISQLLPFWIWGEKLDGMLIDETRQVRLGRYEASRSIAQSSGPTEMRVRRLIYAIKLDEGFWVLTFTAPATEFEQDLPIFEESARSFSIQQEP